MTTVPLTVRLNAADNIVVARLDVLEGTALAGEEVAAAERIPAGHKVATRPIAKGEPVRKFGQIIGFASADIAPGQHVHVQNCAMGDFERDYAIGQDVKPIDYVPEARAAELQGLSARQRQGGDAQLYRRALDRELLRHGVQVHRRALPAGGAGAVPERRRGGRHHPFDRLRHGRPRRGLRHAAAHALGLRRASELRRHPDDRPGLRGDADRFSARGLPDQARPLVPHHDDAGHGRHAEDDRACPRHDQGDAAARQRGWRASPSRSPRSA